MSGPVRRTVLHETHRRLGARMVEFSGWEMPVSYTGILGEHRAVRARAGLFDASHMGEIEIRGPLALAALQRLVTNDAGRLTDGRAQYSIMCADDAGVVDDVIYSRLAADRFLVCVNAGNRDKDLTWIQEHAHGAEIVDRGDELGLLALQGPAAAAILAPLVAFEVASLAPFAVVETTVAGIPAMVSRTGYTGEDGFEIFPAERATVELWNRLLEAGAPHGLVPAGLGARDTLRLEKALSLYGHEIDETTTPLEARLGWVVRFDKGDFIGREALVRQQEAGLAQRLVGLEMEDGAIPRQGYRVMSGDTVVGRVTSGTKSPMLDRGIGLAYVGAGDALLGTKLDVEIRGKRHPAHVVRTPFVSKVRSGPAVQRERP